MVGEKWEKVLYKRQNFPDNYVPPSFLSELRKNENLQTYTWSSTITGASRVSYQISNVALFLVLFLYMNSGKIDSSMLLIAITFILPFIYLLLHSLGCLPPRNMAQDILSTGVYLIVGLVLSPLIHSLTLTISTNTIHCMALLALGLHLLVHDYSVHAAVVSETVSLNAATFATVCLASRLASTQDTFALLVAAAIFFLLGPLAIVSIKGTAPRIYASWVVFQIIATTLLLSSITPSFAVLFTIIIGLINVLGPCLFLRALVHKQNIYGPWDEAVIT